MIYRKTCALVLSDNLEAVGGQTVVNTILMRLFTPFSEGLKGCVQTERD